MLDEAAHAHPGSWWWIKADGADLVSGLGESVNGLWSGDVDLADGALAKVRHECDQQLHLLGKMGRDNPDSDVIVHDRVNSGRESNM